MRRMPIVMAIIISCITGLFLPGSAKKVLLNKESQGELIFKQYCANCHTGGGNMVNARRPVAGSDKLVSIIAFKNYLSAPPGHMPYYKNVVEDSKTLKALYAYCKGLKKQPLKTALR